MTGDVPLGGGNPGGSGGYVTLRGLTRLHRSLELHALEIKMIRNKGSTALTNEADRMIFMGMASCLDGQLEKFHGKWAECFEYSESRDGDPEFPTEADNQLRLETMTYYYEAKGYELHISSLTTPPPTNLTLPGSSRLTLPAFDYSQVSAVQRPRTILPKIPIKVFSGDIAQWPSFKQLFSSLIKTEASLSAAEKFHYLLSYLTGPAYNTIKHIPVMEENFEQAWDALLKAYDDKRKIACTYLDRLLNFKPSSGKPTYESLQSYLSSVLESVTSLKNLAIPNLEQFLLCELALRGLDPKTREAFEIDQIGFEFPSCQALEDFVQGRCQVFRLTQEASPKPSTDANQGQKSESKPSSRPKKSPNRYGFSQTDKSQSALLAHSTKSGEGNKTNQGRSNNHQELVCFICKKSHNILSCDRFKSAQPKQRLDMLKQFQGCRNCLHPFHRTKDCSSKFSCRECDGRHHTDLHLPQSNPSTQAETSSSNQQSGFIGASTSSQHQTVLLGTVVAHIKSLDGKLHSFRGVLDPGSMFSFITEQCARQLGQTTRPFHHNITGVNHSPLKNVKGKVSIAFAAPSISTPLETEAIVVPSITPPLPQACLDSDIWLDYQSYSLSDPSFTTPGPISFLIGADLYPDVVTGAPITIHDQGPRLMDTVFGYTVLGKYVCDSTNAQSVSLLTCADISSLMERFWEVEEPSSVRPHQSQEDEDCEKHFLQTHRRNTDGRYIVALPFKTSSPKLPFDSKKVVGRLQSLERKFSKDEELRCEYHKFMDEYISLRHMSPSSVEPQYLIPHHPVFKINPDGSKKLRVVFDASFQTPVGSLNDHLFSGPKLQSDICDIVLHFRCHRYVLTCDIVKMFRQILVRPEDHVYQQIAWRSDPSQPVQYYDLKTVTYGLRCSPYLAQRVLHQLVNDEGDSFPHASSALLHHTYVDDIAYGADTTEQLSEAKHQLIQLLAKGGFELDKWHTNYPPLLDSTTTSQQPVEIHSEEPSTTKILGMQWNPSDDTFSYHVMPSQSTSTKRSISSVIARLFDPLGYLTPVIFQAKCILQELWKLKMGWDEAVPEDVGTAWSRFMSELPMLSAIAIPRKFPQSTATYQLLCFSDASEKGYCGVVYLRASQGDSVSLTLLKAKTRVAPLKALTVPRLELCGTLLLARVIESLHRLRQTLGITQVFCFTDSTIVLAWLKTPTYLLQTFVANRVQQVLDITDLNSWHHVRGADNPADIGSRGIAPSALRSCDLWWSGPTWCHYSIDTWPISTDTSEVHVPELRHTVLSLMSVSTSAEFLHFTDRYSSFTKLNRVMAYIKRFIINCRIPKKHRCARSVGPLSSFEIHRAKQHSIQLIQHYFYPQPFSNVNPDNLPLEIRRLAVFIDNDGLLRVGGRLRHAPLPASQRHPILLPSRSHFTTLIVDYYHRQNHHAGPTALLASIRRDYWIPAARNLVKLVRRKCVVCIRFSKQVIAPLMGDLPEARFHAVRPFLHTGVDFAGPFLCRETLRRNSGVRKSYLCVYICMSSRAVHLELALGLSVEDFLDTFDRFVSRRGLPSVMYSDCGTNFVGAAGYLKDVFQWFHDEQTKTAITDSTSHLSIQWKFNPPLSPHFGGSWEAAVKAAKSLIFKTVGNQPFTCWELSTIFTKVECILNSRPLQPLCDSPEDSEALTPGHFIIGHPLNAVPELDLTDIPSNRLTRWQLIRERIQFFWYRWKEEYVRGLQDRGKWTKTVPNLQVGDLVLISDLAVPVTRWPMARIISLHPGADGVVRVVTLKTAQGVYKRPAVKLVPLRLEPL